MLTSLRARLSAFRRWLADLATPFSVIAHELRRMNDLKELELAERLNPKTGDISPVVPRNEVPGNSDTEVFFGTESDAHGIQAMREKLARQWANEIEDEEDA